MNSDLWNAIGGIGQGVEAIVVIITAFALLYQVNRWRQESGSHIAQAMDWLSNYLNRDEFKDQIATFINGDMPLPSDFIIFFNAFGILLLEYDQLAYLIEKKFITKELLFRINSRTIAKIVNKINDLLNISEYQDDLSIILEISRDAYQLLKEGHEWENERTQKYLNPQDAQVLS